MSPAQMPEVEIVDVCETVYAAALAEQKKAQDALNAAKADLSTIRAFHIKGLKGLEKSKREIEEIVGKMKERGLDVPADLKAQAATIDSELDKAESGFKKSAERIKLEEELPNLEEAAHAAGVKVSTWSDKLKVAEELKKQFEDSGDYLLGISKVRSFGTLSEAKAAYYAQVPIVLHLENDGKVRKASYWLNYKSVGCATSDVKGHDKYYVQRIPRDLSWIKELDAYADMPAQDYLGIAKLDGVYLVSLADGKKLAGGNDAKEKEEKQAMISSWDPQLLQHESEFFQSAYFYVESTREFYAVWPNNLQVADITFERQHVGYGNWEDRPILKNQRDFDASKLFIDFKDHNSLEVVSWPEQLSARLSRAISKFATTQNLFEPRDVRLPTSSIWEEIGIYWDAFVSSPWAEEIDSPALIMLKHLCERGIERPHFWTLQHKGHYGFRVRTRDHSWIVGRIFCPPFALKRSSAVTEEVAYLKVSHSYISRIVKVGEAAIYVEGFIKDER